MVTENVNIAFRETGIRIIKRNIDELGQAANRATRGIFLLQRALFVLGGAGILRGLASQLDMITNYENRLKLTTTSSQNLQAVQTKLFDVARRSRTSFEGVNEIYNRTALSARALGVSQTELLRFTESVSKAATISGASAREANAALIQLGQGIASNRLGGDELRSILEQLPYVADIIATYMTKTGEFGKVGRGELRALGTEGKITAKIILEAFKDQAGGIDAIFAGLTPTIGQAAVVAQTNWLEFLDTFDDITGASEKVARMIMFLSANIGVAVTAASALAAVLLSSFTGSVIAGIASYIKGLAAASVKQTAVLTRLVSIRNATVMATQAQMAANAADIRHTQIGLVRIRQAQVRAQQLIAETTAEVRVQQALAAQTGSYIALARAKDNVIRSTAALTSLQAAEAAGAARLAAAQAGAAGAANAAAAAQGRLGIAQAAQATWGARLTSMFPLLAGVVRAVGAAFLFMNAAVLANPIGAILAVIVLAIGALWTFGNNIKVTADGVVGLKDAVVAAFQLMWEWISRVGSELWTAIQPGLDMIKQGFNDVMAIGTTAFSSIVAYAIADFNLLVGTIVGFVNGTIAAWDILPAALGDVFTLAMNAMIDAIEGGINAILTAFYDLPTTIGTVWTGITTMAGDAATYLVDAFRGMPAAISALAGQAAAFLKQKLLTAINAVITGLNKIPGIKIGAVATGGGGGGGSTAFSLPAMPDFSKYVKGGLVDLQSLKGQVGTAAAEAGAIYGEEFTKAYSRDFAGEIGKSVVDSLTPVGDAIIERSRKNLADKAAQDARDKAAMDAAGAGTGTGTGAGAGGKKGKGGASTKSFEDLIKAMEQEIELLGLSNKEREIGQELLKMEKELKRGLTEGERELAVATIQSLEAAKMQSQLLQDIIGPREKAIEQMAALNALYAAGRINLQDYTAALLDVQNAANAASGTFAGSFKSAIGDAILTTAEFGKAIGEQVVGFVNSASDAIVEFAKTGKLSLRDLFGELFANLLKLAAQQLMLRALGSILGIAGGGIGAGLGSKAGGGLTGFSTGGSIMPSGPGSTDSQIVAFAKRPDERVDILTPGQQNAKRQGKGEGSSGTTVVQSPGVNVALALNSSDIVSAFSGSPDAETVVVNMIQRNASTIRRIVNG